MGRIGALALATAAPAQMQVRYGEPARKGTITSVGQTHRFLLVGAQQLASVGSSAWVTTPLFACLVAVPISAAATGLLRR